MTTKMPLLLALTFSLVGCTAGRQHPTTITSGPAAEIELRSENRKDHAISPKEMGWIYTSIKVGQIDFEESPEYQSLIRSGWTLMYMEDSDLWVGGVDRPAGMYAVFRHQRSSTP